MIDLIERQAVLDLAKDICVPQKDGTIYRHRCIDPGDVRELPGALRPDYEFHEWCHDCKEYDQKQHCCHRWTQVIRNTYEEIKAREKPVRVIQQRVDYSNYDEFMTQHLIGECDYCGTDVIEGDNYCSYCGCKLEWKE